MAPIVARLFGSFRLSPASCLLRRRFATEVKQPLQRGNFKELVAADVEAFRGMVGNPDASVITSLDAGKGAKGNDVDLTAYNEDWMQKYRGASKLVLKPKSVEEVSKIMAYCVQNRLAVVPQGGNTGLVGGSVPVFDEVILSTAGLDKIRQFDETAGVLNCDSGCILQTLDDYVGERGYMMPLDLGAKGSCHLGGNLATNAGGLRLLRYGSLHGSVLGLEVVLPDERGTVVSVGMGGLRKDNTGYDLKQLFIGSEGTLGIITGISILTPKRSKAVNVALLSVPSFAGVQEVFKETRTHLGEILSAFEFFDQECMDLVLHHTGQKSPFETSEGAAKSFFVLIETSGSNEEHDSEKLSGLLEALLESEKVSDGVLADNATQLQSLWSLRESIPEAAGKLGKVYKYDLSMPVPSMYSLVEEARKRFASQGLDKDGSIKGVLGYGHVGDGNLHINIVAKQYEKRIEQAIEPWIYGWVEEHAGSISAEHGLGLMKAPYIGYSKSAESVEAMRGIKQLFDPRGILNPYKYLPPA